MRNLIIGIFLVLGLSACSSQHDTSRLKDGSGRVIYQMSQEEAFAMARQSMATFFPGRKIFQVEEELKGYRTWTTVVVDRYHQYILVVPAIGKSSAGQDVSGFYFQISGRGTSGSGYMANGAFFDQFQQDLQKTGRAVKVSDVRPGHYSVPVFQTAATRAISRARKGASAEEKLRDLDNLRAKGLITDQEYRVKRQQILDTL